MIAWIGIKSKVGIYNRTGVVVGAKGDSADLNFDPLARLCDAYRNELAWREKHALT